MDREIIIQKKHSYKVKRRISLRPSAFASRLFDPSGCDRQTDELKVYISFLKIKKVRDVKLIYNSCLTYEVRRPLRQVNDTTRTSKHFRKYELSRMELPSTLLRRLRTVFLALCLVLIIADSAVGITIDSIQKEGIACFELAAAFPELQRLEGNFILVISTECN